MTDNTSYMISPSNWEISDSIIKVIGVGGGGCNAVNYMFSQDIKGCSFVVCNTDSQALNRSAVPTKLQMGRGLGAGTNPDKGRDAALESQDKIKAVLDDRTQMLFITAGMGGGTGTGAAPVIARLAKERGILTVAVVTLPFSNEGNEARARAIDGIHELERNVDSLLIINNEKLYDYFGDLLIYDAFPKADEVLATAVKGIIEIIKKPGYINVDFEDVKTMMKGSGMALMGCGTGSGPDRIEEAVKEAFASPLLNEIDLKTARNVLINISTGRNEQGLKMTDLATINEKINEYTGGANNFKRGLIFDDDPEIGDTIKITAIATGFKFNTLIGPDVNLGRIIMIDKDFVWDGGKTETKVGEEIEIPEDPVIRNGIGLAGVKRCFHFTEEPDIVSATGEEFAEIQNNPAFYRRQRK